MPELQTPDIVNSDIAQILNPAHDDFESCYGLNASMNQKHYVKSFGYEIEGGFSAYDDPDEHECNDNCSDDGCDYSIPGNPRTSKYFKHDGSVDTRHYTAGEIASPVFHISTDKEIRRFRRFVNEHYPQEVNSTCGHHVHLGLNDTLTYQKLMSENFFDEFVLEVKKFYDSEFKSKAFETTEYANEYYNRFESRWNNENSYCKKEFSPNSQANEGFTSYDGTDSGRYTFLNYCFRTHKTLECRLFPASNNPAVIIKVTEWFIKFTNSYLKKLEKKERVKKHKLEIAQKESTLSHEVSICV